MAADQAQRLIAMSLSKIAASRSQRGGANLHRSLLVSTVLHKARTTIMMENFQAMMQQRRAHMEQQQQQQQQQEQEQRFCVEEGPERPATPVPAAPAPDTWDKENATPACERLAPPSPPPTPSPVVGKAWSTGDGNHHNHQQATPAAAPTAPHIQQHHSSCVLSTTTTTTTTTTTASSPLQLSNVDNVRPSAPVSSAKVGANCARCVKRRAAELVTDGVKRARYGSDLTDMMRSDDARDAQDDDSISAADGSEDSGRRVEATPITALVQRFNSGLSGLLTPSQNPHGQSQTPHGQQACGEQAFSARFPHHGSDSTLGTRPCIALTV